MEIERKFLLERLPEGAESCPRTEIEQSYVSLEPEVRIRKADNEYFVTEKSEGTMVRRENEQKIDREEYLRLKDLCITRTIEKTRYFIPIEGGLVAEADVYHGHLQDHMVVEVEFEDVAAGESFTPPEWFGREVTEDMRFKNKNLAQLGWRE